MSPVRRRVLAAAAVVAAVLIHVGLQWGPLFARGFSWSSFRSYFAGDQLSYMSMVVNVSNGDFGSAEPFTQTGTNNYPHLYYNVLGLISRVTGISPLQAWSLGGLVAQALLVALLGVTLYLVSSRWWTALLAPVPFVLGSFAVLLSDNWFTSMDSHAVLWGPFGVLFTLNGESAALCLGAAAMLVMLIAHLRVKSSAWKVTLFALASAAIGLLANIQTYSFLTTVYLASYVIGTYVIVTSTRRILLTALSGVLVVMLFVFGPIIAADVGPLVTLAMGLVPMLPALVALVVRTKGLAVLFLGLAGIAASPQIIGTMLGILGDDPFLTYRVASSKNLGVDWRGIVGALALLVPLAATLVAGIRRRVALWIAYPIGAVVVWALGSTNDIWGANQEPYRFWLDLYVLIAITSLPVFVHVATAYLGAPAPDARTVQTENLGDAPRPDRATRPVALSVIAVCVLVAGVSALDFARFSSDETYHSLWNFNSPRDAAIGELGAQAASEDDDLVLTDPCIDVLAAKVTTGAPIVHFNAGMAWPAAHEEVKAVMVERAEGTLDPASLDAAGVGWVLTDSACDGDWQSTYAASIDEVDSRVYFENDEGETEDITLWRVKG